MQNSYSNENYAGFWVRLAAYIIDSIIVAVGLLVVRLAWLVIGAVISGTILDGNVLFHYSLKDIVLYIFKVMYFILLTWCTGTTIGKRLMNLRVVSADRNEKLSFVDVLYRETVGRFLCGISIWIGYIIVGIDKEKRGFHDMLCDTRVVYEKKVKVYPEYQRPMETQMPVQPQEPVWTETPVQLQESVQPQGSMQSQGVVQSQQIYQESVQRQPQNYTQDSMQQVVPQNYVQRNVQMQNQLQPGQSHRAVPDGGYSFVGDAGQVKNAFTQAESEKTTGTTGENVIEKVNVPVENESAVSQTEIKEKREKVEDNIGENIQEGDL